MTKQRAVILESLRSVTSHPTADELYGMVRKKMPRISLGTVYRNLDLLVNAGEVLCLERAGSQKHFDGNPAPHQHVRCRQCGRIGDIMTPTPLPELNAVDAPGFTVQEAEIEFIGVCDFCRQKEN